MQISVIIPAYNAEKTVAETLRSVLNSAFPKNQFEVIVVDDGSKDNTVKILKQTKNVRVFARKHAGPASQRNFGVRMAKGDIVLFTDSDCIIPKDLLKRVSDDFKKYEIVGVGGTYRTLNRESLIARYVGYEIGLRHERENKFTDFLGTYCCAYKRDIFLKFGGFYEKFLTASGEDPELSFRVSRKHKLLLDKKLFVWHPHPDSLRRYLRNQYWRAYWRVLMYKKFPKKILGESYTGKEIPMASAFMLLFLLTLFLSAFQGYLIYVSLLCLLLFYSVYYRFFRFLMKEEKMQVLYALIILPIRTIICFLGFFYGLIKIKSSSE
jgi:glycosyltransferase involved in cell wall biosynthesis